MSHTGGDLSYSNTTDNEEMSDDSESDIYSDSETDFDSGSESETEDSNIFSNISEGNINNNEPFYDSEFDKNNKNNTDISDETYKRERSKCAPGTKYDGKSCFNIKSLQKIANSYNENYNKNIKITNDKDKLLKNISRELRSKCKESDHQCWLKQDFVKGIHDGKLKNYTFKPEKPSGQFTWLSTTDILKVLKQFEKAVKDFAFFGPVPIDFDDIMTEIQDINISELHSNNIGKLGFVFNLDPHYKGGSHWVSMFLNIDKKFCGYFDSYGHKIPKRINILMDRLIESCKNDINVDVSKLYNKKRFQYKKSECGVYCMYFIIECLKNKGFNDICSKKISDDDVNKRRNFFYLTK